MSIRTTLHHTSDVARERVKPANKAEALALRISGCCGVAFVALLVATVPGATDDYLYAVLGILAGVGAWGIRTLTHGRQQRPIRVAAGALGGAFGGGFTAAYIESLSKQPDHLVAGLIVASVAALGAPGLFWILDVVRTAYTKIVQPKTA